MNALAAGVRPGSEGIKIIPFGNGAERMLGNKNTECIISGVNFNIHDSRHLLRAAQEGIAYSIRYGMEILNETGIDISVIRAGNANMFLSNVFRNILSSVTGTEIEIFDTDGAAGAARASGYGSGFYRSIDEAMKNLALISSVGPDMKTRQDYNSEYVEWKALLDNILNNLKS
jgi:xylulokinase